MSQPIRYVKDSKLFTVVIEDFASLMDGRLNTRPLGLAGGQYWHFGFEKVVQDQEAPLLKLSIIYYSNNWDVKSLDIRFGFYIDNQGSSTSYFYQSESNLETRQRIGTTLLVDKFLDEKCGFLENGALKIQVEIRVLAIIDRDGIRSFNFHDSFEGCVTVSDGYNKFYVAKTLISHHCSLFAKEISKGNTKFKVRVIKEDHFTQRQVEVFLQLLHGVPLETGSFGTLSPVIQHAFRFDVINVLQYCSNVMQKNSLAWWRAPIHCLPINHVEKLIRTVKSEVEFREYTGQMIRFLDQMNSELLKAIVKKFFSFAADNDDNDKITVSE